MAEEVENTGKHKIDNGEAWEKYVILLMLIIKLD